MQFKLKRDAKGLVIHSTNVPLEDRWTVLTPEQMQQKAGGLWTWFNAVMARRGERTKLHSGYDNVVQRPVIVKTIFYRDQDLQSMETIEQRRNVLREQIAILNKINSPLLPEPLDWFEVENTIDDMPIELRSAEPVLVLDYLPGMALSSYYKNRLLHFKEGKEGKGSIDTPKIGRIALKFLQFLRVLDEKGYGYLDFRPEHVLFLKNDIPRFVGIGSICAVKEDGTLDENHINFSRTTKGYAAPELLNSENNWASAKKVKPSHIAAYSLGVMIHQMVLEKQDFIEGTVKRGSFFYPNGVSEEQVLKCSTNE